MRSTAAFAPFQQQAPPFIDPTPKPSAFAYKPIASAMSTTKANMPDDKFTERLSAMLQQESSMMPMVGGTSSTTSNLYPARPFYSSQPMIRAPISSGSSATTTAPAASTVTSNTNDFLALTDAHARPLSAMDDSRPSLSGAGIQHHHKYKVIVY